jgi:hypothetical protein
MQKILFLRKLRDFGEKISDTFLFLKRNWKGLFSVFAIFVVPFLLVALILSVSFASRVYSLFTSNAQAFQPSDFFTFEFFLILICLLLAGTSYNTAVYCYFRRYDEGDSTAPGIPLVGQLYFRKLLPVFFYNFVSMLMLIIVAAVPMALLIFIPLINIFAVMMVGLLALTIIFHLNAIYVVEDVGLIRGISRLFYLLKGSWWSSIGFTVVIFIIYYVFSFVIQFGFMMVFTIVRLSIDTSHVTKVAPEHGFVVGAVLFFGIMLIIQQIFYLIVFTGISINYYSLSEEKDGSAIEAQIESIGESSDRYGGIEEQY